ncbi:MAG: hypothetical protein E7L40_02465 [Corynebacterium kroppenstedtii]|uniref:hypothetical protein n=1 Tax=Corynebacterium kroppenstedtii TaxID=161879 RepID=UPI0026F0A146|nr:hypothetical protein [Corynebacterium kroppenstedtii]MDU7286479.1 hypothetical protein [Corynebacterium kroppenstedtii]
MWWRRVVNNWQQRNMHATDSSCKHPLRTRLRSYSIASAGDDDISQFPPVPTSSVSRSPIGLVAVYATIIGIIVGAFIAGVAQLILFTERLVYGSDHQHEISPLDSLGPTINLLIHLVAVGFISGVGWAVLHWRSTRRVSIPQAMHGSVVPPTLGRCVVHHRAAPGVRLRASSRDDDDLFGGRDDGLGPPGRTASHL